MKKQIVVAVMIDALRYDFLESKSITPFLHKLKEHSQTGVLTEPFGFIGVRAACFAGLTPKESNYSFVYTYNNQFQINNPLSVIAFLKIKKLRSLFIRLYNWFLSLFFKERVLVWPISIPPEFLRYFEMAEKHVPWSPHYLLGKETIFSRLSQDDYLYYGYPNNYGKVDEIVEAVKNNLTEKTRFLWLHFSEVDWMEHAHGPESFYVHNTLKKIDGGIETIYKFLNDKGYEIRLLVFGDHGCVDVKENIDIISRLGLKPDPQKVVYFIDSTMIRLWFHSEEYKEEVTDRLKAYRFGHCITDYEREKYMISKDRDTYGDICFVLDEGYQFFPNYYQSHTPSKGMHGYLPDAKNNRAAYVFDMPDTPPLLRQEDMSVIYKVLRHALEF